MYMKKDRELTEDSKAIKNVADDKSWFRDTPHYWAEASLPLAYAVACVEVVANSSEKAGILYNRIIEGWSDAGIKTVFDEISSIMPDVIQDDSCVLTTGQTSHHCSVVGIAILREKAMLCQWHSHVFGQGRLNRV